MDGSAPTDRLIQVLAIVVPIFMAIIAALLKSAVTQAIGRMSDKMASLQAEITEHKERCERVDKGVLLSRLEAAEGEVKHLRKFAHWTVESIARIAGKADVKLPEHPQS